MKCENCGYEKTEIKFDFEIFNGKLQIRIDELKDLRGRLTRELINPFDDYKDCFGKYNGFGGHEILKQFDRHIFKTINMLINLLKNRSEIGSGINICEKICKKVRANIDKKCIEENKNRTIQYNPDNCAVCSFHRELENLKNES